MTRLHGALLAAAVCLLSTTPAMAQIVGRPIEISGQAGYFKPDDRARTSEGPMFGGSVGMRLLPWMTLEGQALFAPSKADSGQNQKHNFSFAGLDARFHLLPPSDPVVPFVLVGTGYGLSHSSVGGTDDKLDRGAATLGLGALWNIRDQRTYVRFQVRDIMFRERGLKEFSNHAAVSIGLQYHFGGTEQDTDFDGVRDRLDKCPDTPLGAKVDANGCPLDSDRDGVFDGLDRCPDTKTGCVVDSTGCAIDSDGDGVCDGLDQCADTPAGADVDEAGCPRDADGDGVLAGIDKCPDTPKGCTVDENGCSTDSDGDGVCDGIDECPNTPPNTPVNAAGCPYQLDETERSLLETGKVRIKSVNFVSARGDLDKVVFPLLKRLGEIIDQYPTLQFELVGYTDDRGDTAAAARMSLARAEAVLSWFQKNAPRFDGARVQVKGGGADGVGDRARYVELRILNVSAVPAELEKRTPPPDTGSGDVSPGGAVPDTGGTGGIQPDSSGAGSGAAPDSGSGSAPAPGGGAAPDSTSGGKP